VKEKGLNLLSAPGNDIAIFKQGVTL